VKTVHELVAEVLGIPASRVTDDLQFHSIPEWDSLNHVNLMLALEAMLGVEIGAERMIELDNVASIRRFIDAAAPDPS
jgi:citrate synthase